MKGKHIVNLLSYLAVAFIAIALILGRILSAVGLSAGVVSAMTLIAQIIAYSITAIFAFSYAKTKRNIGWMIAYVVFVIAIIVFMILNFQFN